MTNFDFVVDFKCEMFSKRLRSTSLLSTFQIHDARTRRINSRNIMCAAGLDENGEAVVAKRFHQRQRIFLEQRSPPVNSTKGNFEF